MLSEGLCGLRISCSIHVTSLIVHVHVNVCDERNPLLRQQLQCLALLFVFNLYTRECVWKINKLFLVKVPRIFV